jgi:futalosine hydrolase
MKLLIVAATWNEIKPLEEYLLQKDHQKAFSQHAVEILITGPGTTMTAFHLGKMLPLDNWDAAINLGICGSFNRTLAIGTTVLVTRDTFADLGAEDGDSFLDIFELGLADKDLFPFRDRWINNPSLQSAPQPGEPQTSVSSLLNNLPQVSAVTVNCVTGTENSIRKITEKYHADIESMEGAAFLYCCMKESIPCLQIRTISNYIEKRDRNKWEIPLAVVKLNSTAIGLVEALLKQ